MERRDVLPDIHHRLRSMLQDAKPVLDIAHDLPVILLVLLEELGVLFHLIVHLASKRLDLILQSRIKIMKLLLELKEDVGSAVVPLLRSARGDPPEGVVVSSFDAAALRTVRALAPEWPTWLIVVVLGPRGVRRASVLGCSGIAAEHRSIRAPSVALAHAAGLDVAAWTVRGRGTVARLAGLGVVAACAEGAALDGR